MQVRITQTTLGSPDGRIVRQYEAGTICELPEGLATQLIAAGAAEPCEPSSRPASPSSSPRPALRKPAKGPAATKSGTP